MFGLIKKMCIRLLTSIVSASNHAKCVLLGNQKYLTQSTFIKLHPNKYHQELHYYTFAVKLDRCVGSCNTLNDLSNKVCVPKQTEVLNLSVFNMITGIKELKTLTKHVSCEYKCKFDGRKCNVNQKWNNDKCWCKCKRHHICEKDYIWNPATCGCKNGKYLASIIDNSVIMCEEIIDGKAKLYNEETKTITTNFNEKYVICNTQNFYILLAFLLTITALLIAVSIYCYMIKYHLRQKYLLPFHVTNDKLINVL